MNQAIGKHKLELDTPCLVLDIEILEKNLATMQEVARRAGKNLRPHAKTHKCSIIAQKQIEAGAVGMSVAKISEAERLIEMGIRGILVTAPVVSPPKIERFLGCLQKDPSLMVVIDDLDNARSLDQSLKARDLRAGVLIDIDVGLQRTGIAPGRAVEFASSISRFTSIHLKGIQAYAGQVQHIIGHKERMEKSLQEMLPASEVFTRLKKALPECRIFSGAGTGTHDIDTRIPELTELQTGSYAVMDAEYLAIGSAENPTQFDAFQPALTILTTVVSTNQKSFVTVDAGLKAIYRDGANPIVLSPKKEDMTYDWFGDEYGRIRYEESAGTPRLGSIIELIVSHCDPTINLFDRFYVTQNGKVIDVWEIDLRGRSQ